MDVYIVDYRRRRQMKDRLFTRILEEVEMLGERVAIASNTVQLVDPAPFTVHVDQPNDGCRIGVWIDKEARRCKE